MSANDANGSYIYCEDCRQINFQDVLEPLLDTTTFNIEYPKSIFPNVNSCDTLNATLMVRNETN